MTIPAWPAGVPQTALRGSIEVPQTAEPPLRSDMNSGTTRQRRKYSLRIARYSMKIVMTSAQCATFRTFHETTLGDGAARFTMDLSFNGAIVNRTCQFVEPPRYSPLGPGNMEITLSLRVEAL
jgi:hypothetical protein